MHLSSVGLESDSTLNPLEVLFCFFCPLRSAHMQKRHNFRGHQSAAPEQRPSAHVRELGLGQGMDMEHDVSRGVSQGKGKGKGGGALGIEIKYHTRGAWRWI